MNVMLQFAFLGSTQEPKMHDNLYKSKMLCVVPHGVSAVERIGRS